MDLRRRFAALLMVLCCLLSFAHAEELTMPEEPVTVQIDLRLDLTGAAQMGEKRLKQANALLNHAALSLQLEAADPMAAFAVRIDVDGENAVTVGINADGVLRTTALPELAFTGAGTADVLNVAQTFSFAGMDERMLALPDMAYAFADGLADALPQYASTKAINSKVPGMGLAVDMATIMAPKDGGAAFTEAFRTVLPEGLLKELLGGLVFSGKQEIKVLRGKDGRILKVSYNGKCGTSEDTLRSVTLAWRLNYSGDDRTDNFTLSSPAVRGADRNSITFTRTQTVKNGALSLHVNFKHDQVLAKKKNTLTAEAKLEQDKTGRLTGSVTLKNKPDSGETETITVKPALLLDSAALAASGTIEFENKADKRLLLAGTVHVQAAPAAAWSFPADTREVTLTAGGKNAETVKTEIMRAVVRRLVLIPGDDVLYLSDGIDPAGWTKIVETAKTALGKE